MTMTTCERCGSTDDVRSFHGREKCDVSNEWQACSDCRMHFLKKRLKGTRNTESTSTPKPDPEPDPTGLSDFM